MPKTNKHAFASRRNENYYTSKWAVQLTLELPVRKLKHTLLTLDWRVLLLPPPRLISPREFQIFLPRVPTSRNSFEERSMLEFSDFSFRVPRSFFCSIYNSIINFGFAFFCFFPGRFCGIRWMTHITLWSDSAIFLIEMTLGLTVILSWKMMHSIWADKLVIKNATYYIKINLNRLWTDYFFHFNVSESVGKEATRRQNDKAVV